MPFSTSNIRGPLAALIAATSFATLAPGISQGALVFYTTQSAFNAAEPGLPVQGFASANTFGQPYVLQASPLTNSTNNSVFPAGSILPGLTISNLNPALAFAGLIVEGGSVGDNYFGDSLVLSFAPGVSAVGANVFANTSPGPSLAGNFTEIVYGGTTLLGAKNFTETAGAGGFIGVSSTTPITSVQLLYTTDDATTFVNSIAFGPQAASTVPEPSTFALPAFGAVLLGLRIRASRQRSMAS